MGLAILGVLIIGFMVLAYLAARTWEIWHVVVLVFLFLSTVAFCMLAAATLKVQMQWRGKYEQISKQLADEQSLHTRLVQGSPADGELGEPALRNEVRRATVDRGRVWRNLRLADLGDNQLLLDASAWASAGCRPSGAADDGGDAVDSEAAAEADGEGDAAAADAAAPANAAAPAANPPTSLGLEANAVVYAFKEAPLRTLPQELQSILLGDSELAQQDGRGLCKVPVYFMGEYKVVGNADNNPAALVLAPSVPLSEAQIQQLNDPNSTWVLYEMMPVDAHTVFEGLTGEQLAMLLATPDAPPATLQALVQEYTRDQGPATDQDAPERKWMRVKFKQNYSEDVDVDLGGDTGEQPLADTLFDPSGRSLVATLSQGGKTEFKEGDEALFDLVTAQALIADGKADPGEQIYARRLRDYARIFRSYAADLTALDRQIGMSEQDAQKLADSLAELQDQIQFQNEQRSELQFDRDGLQRELQILQDYRAAVETTLTDLRTELSRLYRTNKQMVGRLTSAR